MYILAHDLGTTGNKATLYNSDGQLVGSTFYGYKTDYFNFNWVEQNPEDWWAAVCTTTKQLLEKSGVKSAEIACISFSGQMMGCVAVDRQCNPLRPAIIWADQRSTKEEAAFKEALSAERVYRITGHRASASYSGEKILWIKNNQPEVYKNTFKFLHAKDFIVARLTGSYVTDYSDASGMNLLDINKLEWSDEIVRSVGIDLDKLPTALPSTAVAGKVAQNIAEQVGLAAGTPVVIGGGDGSCAAVGAGVIKEGDAYNYLGSSSWIGIATKSPIYDKEMRTFNWVHLVPGMYSPTGTMQSAGGSVQWLKDNLCQLETLLAEQQGNSPYKLIDKLVEISKPGAERLLYLPYLLGERSPHWNTKARGAFVGLSMMHKKEDICRAVLEGITFNLKIILDIFIEQVNINEIRLIGGGAKSDIWRQIFADIFEITIAKPVYLDEATSLGAGIAGGVGVGIFEDFTVAEKLVKVEKYDHPNLINKKEYAHQYKIFKDSYDQLVPIYEQLAK